MVHGKVNSEEGTSHDNSTIRRVVDIYLRQLSKPLLGNEEALEDLEAFCAECKGNTGNAGKASSSAAKQGGEDEAEEVDLDAALATAQAATAEGIESRSLRTSFEQDVAQAVGRGRDEGIWAAWMAYLDYELTAVPEEGTAGVCAGDVAGAPKGDIEMKEKEAPVEAPVADLNDLGDLSKLTVKVLQKELEDRGLETKGRKAELVERLTKALAGGGEGGGGGEGKEGGGNGDGTFVALVAPHIYQIHGVFERAAPECALSLPFWQKYTAFADAHLGVAIAVSVHRRAVRNLTWDGGLWTGLMHALELAHGGVGDEGIYEGKMYGSSAHE
jgi:hypothetical protein